MQSKYAWNAGLARFAARWSGDVEFVWTHHSVKTLKRRERSAPALFMPTNLSPINLTARFRLGMANQ